MIGVFDSGSGGLTILAALRERLPERDFLYLGDHACAPYGGRTGEEVHALTQVAVERLLAAGCRLVVIACNTAAAVTLRSLQQSWLPEYAPAARILGVHVPLVEAITGAPWRPLPEAVPPRPPRVVGIFATPLTVASHALVTEIGLRAPEVTVLQQPCPGLAEAIERGGIGPETEALVDQAVAGLFAQSGAAALETVALACTHYPFARSIFRTRLPERIALLEQPARVADSLAEYLRRHRGIDRPGRGSVRLLTTGDPARLDGLLGRLPAALRRFEAAGAVAL